MSTKRIVKLAGTVALVGAFALPLAALAQAAPAVDTAQLLPAAITLDINPAALVPLPSDWQLTRVSLGPFP